MSLPNNNDYIEHCDNKSVLSVEETIATYNDRDIGRRGAASSQSRNKTQSISKSRFITPSSRFEPNTKQQLFSNEGDSDISTATWQPAAPGLRKLGIKGAPQSALCEREVGNDDHTTASYALEQIDEEPYVRGGIKRPNSKLRETGNNNYVKFGRDLNTSLIRQEYSGHSKNYDFPGDLDETVATMEIDEEVYYVKQSYGYFSILISVIQIFVLAGMVTMCGVAPLDVNPMLGPYPDSLSLWGAKNAYGILVRYEWWRALSGAMLHVGVVHLFCNVAVQLETAAFFEREWGSSRWLIIYISSSFGSTIAACITNPDSISVVSSGSVLGLFGAKLAEVVCRSCEKSENKQQRISKQVRMEQLSGVFCSVAIVGLFSFIPFIDWSAHAGGLGTGVLVGVIIFSSSVRPLALRFSTLFLGIGGIMCSVYFSIMYILYQLEPDEELADVCYYYQTYFWSDYTCSCGS